MGLAGSQTHLLVIPHTKEHFVRSEFSVAESGLAETEKSINRFAEGIPRQEERRRCAHLARESRIMCRLDLGRSQVCVLAGKRQQGSSET